MINERFHLRIVQLLSSLRVGMVQPVTYQQFFCVNHVIEALGAETSV